MKNEKFDFKNSYESGNILMLAILNEVMDFTNTAPTDHIVDIDTKKFYEHCYNKFFEPIIDRNYKLQNLEKEYTKFVMQMKFVHAMCHVYLYNVEKLRLLELAEEFIKEYKEYLNK